MPKRAHRKSRLYSDLKRYGRRRRDTFRPLWFERLETRTVPSSVTIPDLADGLVADRNLDGVYDAVDTTSTSITDRYFDAAHASGIGQERGVFEFDLSGIRPGTPIASASLGLDVLSYTSSTVSNVTSYPQVMFEAYRGAGTVTTADGASAATAAGNGTVTATGVTSFALLPSVLQSLEGGVVAVRLENASNNGNWFQASDMRDTADPKPVLNLTFASVTVPEVADGLVNDTNLDGVYDTVNTTSSSIDDAYFAAPSGQDRGIFEFDLRGIAPGTPITAATLGFDVVVLTANPPTSYPQATFEAYRGTGTVTTADGSSAAMAAGSGTVYGLGAASFALTPSVLESLEGSLVAIRLENPTSNSDWFSVSGMRDTTHPKPTLNLTFGSVAAPEVADGLVADRNLDGTYDAVDTSSTSITDRFTSSSGIGQERGVFEFDLSGVTPGTPINAASLALDVLSYTTSTLSGITTYPQVTLEAYQGTGTVTTADGGATGTAVGSGSINSLGVMSFGLTPGILESFEGGIVTIRLEDPTVDGNWFQVSDMRDTSHPKPALNLTLGSAAIPEVADGLVADRNLDGVYDAVDTASTSMTDRNFDAANGPGIGEERDVVEFDLSGIAPGTPITAATLALDVLSYTYQPASGSVGPTYPNAVFEVYRGSGTVTTADGGATGTVAGSGSVSATGVQEFTLSPSVLQSFEGGIVTIRLKNPTLNGQWFQVSDMRDTTRPKPALNLVLGSFTVPEVADGMVADTNLDGVYDSVDKGSTSISDGYFIPTVAPGTGQQRGIFEFDLSGIAPGTPITSASLGLNVVSWGEHPANGTLAARYAQAVFEVYAGTGTVTTADGGAAGTVAGSGIVTSLGVTSFALDPGVLESFEGGIVAIRLENPTLDGDTFTVSDMRDTTHPKPVLNLGLNPSSAPTVAGDHYTVAQGTTLTTVAAPAVPAPVLRYSFDEAPTGNNFAQDTGQVSAPAGTFLGGATRTPITPGLASVAALDLSKPGVNTLWVGHASALDSLTAMTVTGWINLRSASSNTGKELISDVNTTGAYTSGWDLQLAAPFESDPVGNTAVTFSVYNSSGAGQGKESTSFTPTNRWVFIAVTFDSNQVATLYEGDTSSAVAQLGQSGSFAYGLAPNTAPLIFGGSGFAPSSPGYTPPAWLDDVRIYGSALTAAQVDAVRRANLPAGVLANDTSPSGLRLNASVVSGPAHGSLTLNGDGTFLYTPTASYFGPDSFSYTASDGLKTSAPATVTLSVVAPPTATPDQYSVVENGSLTVAAASGVLANDSDPNGLPLTATIQSSPAHGTVTLNSDGSFTYTPASGFFGPDTFTYVDSNGSVSSTAATVTVHVDAPPTTGGDVYATPKNTALSVAAPGVLANDTDPNGLSLSAILVTQPAHGTLTLNADGSFLYTPSSNYIGSDSFTYQASDGVATSSTATVTLKVSPPIAAAYNGSVNENEVLTIAAPGVLTNDSDPNGLSLSASVVTQPAHGALTLNSDGSYTYTPSAGYFGSDSFTYQANDGTVSSVPATVSITVNQVGSVSGTIWDDLNASGSRVSADPGLGGRTVFLDLNHNGILDPSEPSATTAADGTYTIKDVPPGTYSVAEVLPSGWAQTTPFSPTSRTVTVPVQTPAFINFSDLTSPNSHTVTSYQAAGYSITVSSPSPDNFIVPGTSDSSRYAGATALAPQVVVATMTLTRTDLVPFALQSIALAPTLKNFSGSVTFTGTRADNSQVSQSAGFGTGLSFTTTPFTNLTNVQNITWTFSNSSNDAQFTNLSLVSGGNPYLTGVNFGEARNSGPVPVPAADAYTGVTSTTLTVPTTSGVLANDTSPQGDPLRTTLVTQPSHGPLTLNADGSFTYTPAYGFYGPDSFTYRAQDGYLSSPVTTVNLTIDRPPVAAADAYALAMNTTLSVPVASGVLANDHDWNGLSMSAALVTGPSHGSLTLIGDGSFSYTPAVGYWGPDSFVYNAGDSVSTSGTTTVTLTIDPGPVANNDTYIVQAGTPLTVPAASGVLANDVSPSNSALTASLVAGPGAGSVSLKTDGSFTYTPPAYAFNGTTSFTYTVSDGTYTSNTATVILNVDTPPTVTNDSYSMLSGSTLTTVPGVSLLVLNSPLGDSLAHGVYKTLNTSTGSFSASLGQFVKNSITINYNDFGYGEYYYPGSSENWSLLFVMPNDAPFVPGTYTGATRAPGEPTTAPGLDVSGDGAGANTLTGQFTVGQANYDSAGNLVSFAASFTQYSDNSAAPLLGQVQCNATGNQPGGVLVNDSDPAHRPMTVSLVSGPGHGSVLLNADGSFSYKPNPGYVGTDSFTYQASDGLDTSAPATATISVFGTPVATADSYDVMRNTPLTVPAVAGVLANDTDPNGLPLTATPVAGPQHGQLNLGSDGSFTYTPAAGYSGPDSFTYQAGDADATSSTATVSLRVDAPPTVVNQAYAGAPGQATSVPAPGLLSGASDLEGDRLTAALVTGPSHGAVVVNTDGSFTYTPAQGYQGTDQFTYKANDGTFDSNTATVNLLNAPPAISIGDVSLPEGNSGTTPFTFNVSLSAVSEQTITVNYATADGTATAGSDYNATSGTLTFAPGVTSQTITVGVIGNTVSESDETFLVTLSNPVGATVARAQAVGTIIDDDTYVIDNGDSGYSDTGAWSSWSSGGYNNTFRYALSGDGSSSATWQTSLPAGYYEVQATWSLNSNRASNATYGIYDGSTLVKSVTVNQQIAAMGVTAGGVGFQRLGVVSISSGTLRVVLTNNANGIVCADAVRVAPVAAPVSDLNWSGGGITVPATAATQTPFTVARTYTVSGSAAPADFTISYYASADAILGNSDDILVGTETITAASDKAVGPHTGTSPSLLIPGGGAYYLFAVLDSGNTINETDETNNVAQGAQVTNVSGPVIVDNGNSGYSDTGAWSSWGSDGYNNTFRFALPGDGSSSATWQTSLPAGSYEVQATWNLNSNRASDATYGIYDGSTLVKSVTVNQQLPALGMIADGMGFQPLGVVSISSGTLRVVLTNNANGIVCADAVRVVPTATISLAGSNPSSGASLPHVAETLAAAPGPNGMIYAIGGGPLVTNEVDAYNPQTNVWTAVASLPTARNGLAATTGSDGTIYAIGGDNPNTGYSAEVDAYNPATNTWTVKASLPTTALGAAATTGSDGTIYVVGGARPGGASGELDAYHPATNTWTVLPSMPIAREYLSAATGPDGTIYAMGGYDSNDVFHSDVEAYNPSTQTWSVRASMPTARASAGVVTGPDGRIYALGGFVALGVGTTEVDAYNPATNTWTTAASLPDDRRGLAAATASDGTIYAIGGLTGTSTFTSEVDALSPVTHAWTRSPVSFTVTFGEPVTGVDASDFSLTTSGITGASVSGVVGSGTTYTVLVSTGTGDGTIGLNLVGDDTILDATGNRLGESGNGGIVAVPTYTIDKSMATSTIATAGTISAGNWTGAITGTADGTSSAVSSVLLTIQRQKDGLYWNGSSYQSGSVSVPAVLTPSGNTATWSYAFALPADGGYNLTSTAFDALGNRQWPFTSATFTITGNP